MPNSFLGWILIGLVAGVLGKMLMPGKDPGGFVVTILIGIAGALLAGYLSPALGLNVTAVWWQSYAAATVGAIILLALYRLVMTRRVR
ncbi:GlsB/YeaQ/YmgE family stress response membrane protein [Sphingomonas sp. ZT3P38]|uniref:GlsB/YeaQ/YmgE family stress response membrane protein n=1 Tax=Parasphingomonas zepuensis TaxID=3096161 RepID=UPI002FC9D35B